MVVWEIKGQKRPDQNLQYCSRCSFSMMVKWANDGLHQANDGECSVQIKILKVRKFLIFTTKIFLLLKLNLNYINVRWFIFKYNVPVIDMNNILLYVVHSLSLKNQLDWNEIKKVFYFYVMFSEEHLFRKP